jgi:imidazolonepropionase-like amidohydrolase
MRVHHTLGALFAVALAAPSAAWLPSLFYIEGANTAHAQGAAPPRDTKLFRGFTLIDGTGRAPITNAAMLVRDGRILAVGRAEGIRAPQGAEVMLMTGYVMPGLINAHGHVNEPADLRTYAAYGVTTIYSLGGESAEVFAARAAQDTPALNRARVFVSGPVLTPLTPAEARERVAEVANQRVDMVKIRVDDNLGTAAKMPPDVSAAVIDEAHKRGLRVATHLFYLSDAKFLLSAGTDLVAHSVRDVDVDAELIAALKTRSVCVSPTLMREVSTFVYESTPEWFSDSLFLAHANKVWVEERKTPAWHARIKANTAAQQHKAALKQASTNLKALSDAGVVIAMGTDTGPDGRFQGYFELMELELMAKAGLTPQQVIISATRDAARCMRIDRELGTLEVGKYADFIALEADPLADVSNIRRIRSVWISGNKVNR